MTSALRGDDGRTERVEFLIRVLGEPVCRRLGIFRLPDDLVLSVVIPSSTSADTIREILRPRPRRPRPPRSSSSTTAPPTAPAPSSRTWPPSSPTSPSSSTTATAQGAALRTGFGRATGQVVLVQDADLEYDPAQYPQLIQPIVEGPPTSSTARVHRRVAPGAQLLARCWPNRFLTRCRTSSPT